jgi:hypothetical protein
MSEGDARQDMTATSFAPGAFGGVPHDSLPFPFPIRATDATRMRCNLFLWMSLSSGELLQTAAQTKSGRIEVERDVERGRGMSQ